jgi:hypothetical protein
MCSINHDLQTIFIHIPKNAGTYIQYNLKNYYNFENFLIKKENHDINYNFNNNEELKKRFGIRYYGIQKFLKNTPHNKVDGIYKYCIGSNIINKKTGMTKEKWKNYKKFCVIRDPYMRIISGYFYNKEYLNTNDSFEYYIFNIDKLTDFEYYHMIMPQYKHIIDENNNLISDYNINFDNLEIEFKETLEKIGIKKILHETEKKNSGNYGKNIINYINTQKILDKVNVIIELDFVYFNFKKYEDINDFYNIYK